MIDEHKTQKAQKAQKAHKAHKAHKAQLFHPFTKNDEQKEEAAFPTIGGAAHCADSQDSLATTSPTAVVCGLRGGVGL